MRAEVAGRTAALKARGIQPHLAIILVGDNPASQVYVKSKAADSEQTGLKATLERYPASLSESALLELSPRSMPMLACTASWCSCPCPRT